MAFHKKKNIMVPLFLAPLVGTDDTGAATPLASPLVEKCLTSPSVFSI
jgi:hypothetical protein